MNLSIMKSRLSNMLNITFDRPIRFYKMFFCLIPITLIFGCTSINNNQLYILSGDKAYKNSEYELVTWLDENDARGMGKGVNYLSFKKGLR